MLRRSSTRFAATAVFVLLASPAAAAPSWSAADGPRSESYRDGQRALAEERWQDAYARFSALAQAAGPETDAALYWQAWTEYKLGQRSHALATLRKLIAEHPESEWVDDGQALELELRGSGGAQQVLAGAALGYSDGAGYSSGAGYRQPAASPEDDLKLYALDALLQVEPERAVPILERLLAGDHSLKLKQRALFVLGQSDTPRSREILVATARSGNPPELRLSAIESLGIAGEARDVAALSAIWKEATPPVRQKILEAWMISGAEAPVLAVAREDADPAMRRKAIEMLGVMGASKPLGELYAREKDPATRAKLLEAYGLAGDVDALVKAARGESDPALRAKAIECLGVFGDERGGRELVALYRGEKDPGLRRKIAEALAINGDAEALVGLFRQESDPELKRLLVQHLSMVDGDEVEQFLVEILEEKP